MISLNFKKRYKNNHIQFVLLEKQTLPVYNELIFKYFFTNSNWKISTGKYIQIILIFRMDPIIPVLATELI